MMEEGSKAENIVNGFPSTAENYDKAFEKLKNRFGRDDLLIEFYTRELLSLAQNSTSKGKQVSVSTIYDKISSHIRALETLGVKTNNCATMLYPLVEPSLPEEILRTCQRSALSTTTGNEAADDGEVPDRLTRLLQFLKAEVSNEERISMAINGFTSQAPAERRLKTTRLRKRPIHPQNHRVLALYFQVRKSEESLFFAAITTKMRIVNRRKKLSYNDRKNLIKEKKCFFNCLKSNHQSKSCRVKISCAWCNNRHSIIVCPSLSAATSVTPNRTDSNDKKENLEQSLASFISMPDVILQTLRVILYSDLKEMVVHVVIDQGSHRFYIRSDIAKFMNY